MFFKTSGKRFTTDNLLDEKSHTYTGKIGRNEEKKRAAEKRRFFIGRLMGGK